MAILELWNGDWFNAHALALAVPKCRIDKDFFLQICIGYLPILKGVHYDKLLGVEEIDE
jgi:hypothetical protein